MTPTPPITGLTVTAVDRSSVLDALTDGVAPTPPAGTGLDTQTPWWMIAERPGDGYTVGRLAPGAAWQFAGTDGRPTTFDPTTVMHLRVFTRGAELLAVGTDPGAPAVWRIAEHTPVGTATTPRTRTVLLEHPHRTPAPARRGQSAAVTVLVHPNTGQRTVIPEPRTTATALTLTVREHFTADPRTGAVRVAAVCWDRYTAALRTPAPHTATTGEDDTTVGTGTDGKANP